MRAASRCRRRSSGRSTATCFAAATLDFSRKFLPDGLSLVDRLDFLPPHDARLLSQIQGRTYAYLFGLVERFISAKMLDQTRAHILGDQHALEGLVRFSGEELKHQELFRRLEQMIGAQLPAGYTWPRIRTKSRASCSARARGPCSALTCHIELFVQAHYEQSIEPRAEICARCSRTCSASTGATSAST